MAKADILVSAVAIVRNDGAIVPTFLEDLSTVLAANYADYEIVLIDNGSVDGTPMIVQGLLHRHKGVRYLPLTRAVDGETALMAGLDAVVGDYVVTLHPDFDSPAELVPMVETCRAGTDLVLGVDRNPPKPALPYRVLRQVFLMLSRWLVQRDQVFETTEFRVLSRQAVNALVKVRLRRRYFAVIATDVGLRPLVHFCDRISRSGRKPVYRLGHAVRSGLSLLVHNSITPLRMVSGVGMLGSLLSFTYSLYVVAIYVLKEQVMPGWTTLSLAMSGLFGLAFLMLALISEYLGRLIEETSNRPLYHVRDEQSSAVVLSELTRRNVLGFADAPDPKSRIACHEQFVR
jgi:glycosyltransferase involved in cell wall biosynthesis